MRWIILVTVLAAATAVNGCPTNLKKHIDHCIGPFKGIMKNENHPDVVRFMTELQNIQKSCSIEGMQDAFRCLNRLYDKCAKSNENGKELGLIMKFKQWESAVNLLCNNIGYLQNNAQCTIDSMPEFLECFGHKHRGMVHRLNVLENEDIGYGEKTEKKSELVCLLNLRVKDECVQEPFSKHCSPPLTNMFLEIFSEFMPPGCSQWDSHFPAPDEPARGPAYRISHEDQHRTASDSASGRGSSSSRNNNNNNNNNKDSFREDLVSIPGLSQSIAGDADDRGEDEVDTGGVRPVPDNDRGGDNRENVFRAPGVAAQAKESDKGGAAGVHSMTVNLAALLAVFASSLAAALTRIA